MGLPKLIYTAATPDCLNNFRRNIMKKLSSEFEVIALSSAGSEQEEIAEREGARIITVEIKRRFSPIKDVLSLYRLIRVFRKERPLIVHSMSAKSGLVSMMAAKFAGVPYRVHTFSGLAFPTATGLSRVILVTTEKLTCMCANHLLPEGKGVMSALKEHITKKEMTVLGYGNIRGIDLKKYDRSDDVMQKAKEIREPDTYAFIFVGRIVRDKGINELVRAFDRLYKDNNRVRLYLVGGYDSGIDPVEDQTLATIKSNPGIKSFGQQKDVIPYYAAADCLAFPSYREGFPNVVIEAGAMGLPSIVSNIYGCNEIIEDGVNGLIIPSKNEDALFKAMYEMASNTQLSDKLASNARRIVAERYEESFVQGCLIDYYHKIMKTNGL